MLLPANQITLGHDLYIRMYISLPGKLLHITRSRICQEKEGIFTWHFSVMILGKQYFEILGLLMMV